MKFLANENFPIASVRFLRQVGYDVTSVGENYAGVSDEYIMDIAISEQRTIITFDRDYGELIYKYGYRPDQGVIYLRLFVFEPDEPGRLIQGLIQRPDMILEGTFTVFDGVTIRQRKY